jgi:dTDP-4-dehydrorhamnose reductase
MSGSGRSLIVGASGQIGTQIARVLGPARSIASARKPSTRETLTIDLGSLTSEDARILVEKIAPNAIYCVGAMSDVERCESENSLAMRINCEGPTHLAAAAAAQEIPFVYFSTEYVFNGIAGPYTEDATADPINVYGKSKWQGELSVISAHARALIIRTTVVYGPDPGEKNFLYQLRRALLVNRPMRVAEDQLSTPTYNLDLALNTVALVRAGASGVFHICGPERCSRLEFARRAARLMGLDDSGISGAPTCDLGQRAARPLNAGLLTERLSTFEGHSPMRTLKESISDWVTA